MDLLRSISFLFFHVPRLSRSVKPWTFISKHCPVFIPLHLTLAIPIFFPLCHNDNDLLILFYRSHNSLYQLTPASTSQSTPLAYGYRYTSIFFETPQDKLNKQTRSHGGPWLTSPTSFSANATPWRENMKEVVLACFELQVLIRKRKESRRLNEESLPFGVPLLMGDWC